MFPLLIIERIRLIAGVENASAVAFLKTPEAIVEYLNLALESGDHGVFLKALGNAAKAKGMTDVSNKTNIERTTLYRALSGDQDTGTGVALKVLQALDIKLTLEPAT